MAVNTTLALGVATGGAVLVWAGLTDPPGGIPGALSALLAGKPLPVKVQNSAMTGGVLSYMPALLGAGSAAAGGATPAALTSGGGSPAVVAQARKFLGIPYAWGGGTMTAPSRGFAQGAGTVGFDCSGLTRAVYHLAAGIDLPRVAAAQALKGTAVAAGNVQPGDLVCIGRPVYHVGIAVGGGRMIAAPHTGTVVQEQAIWSAPSLTTYRRITSAQPAKTPGVIYT